MPYCRGFGDDGAAILIDLPFPLDSLLYMYTAGNRFALGVVGRVLRWSSHCVKVYVRCTCFWHSTPVVGVVRAQPSNIEYVAVIFVPSSRVATDQSDRCQQWLRFLSISGPVMFAVWMAHPVGY